MKNLFIVFFLMPLFAWSNNNEKLIIGSWIKTKVELKDGSRFIARQGTYGTGYLKFDFLKGEIMRLTTTNIFGSNGTVNYKINDTTLNIGNSSYRIIRLNQDSLVAEFIDSDIEENKQKVFYFTRLEKYHSDIKPVFNEEIKEDVYPLSDFVFPVSNGAKQDIERHLFNLQGTGELRLAFIINKKGNLEALKVLRNDSLSVQVQADILNAFKLSRVLWKPAIVNGVPVSVATEMAVRVSNRGGYTSVFLIPPVQVTKDSYDYLPLNLVAKAQDYKAEAFSYAKAHEFDKAISSCTKCLEIDNIDIDVYYLRATLYFETKNMEAACNDWQKLAQLGQVLGTKYAMKYCNH